MGIDKCDSQCCAVAVVTWTQRLGNWQSQDSLGGFLSAPGFVTPLLSLHPCPSEDITGNVSFLEKPGSCAHLAPPDSALPRTCHSSPGWLQALSSICIPAVGIISGAEREGAHAVPFPSWTSLGPVAFSFLFYWIVKRLPAGYR